MKIDRSASRKAPTSESNSHVLLQLVMYYSAGSLYSHRVVEASFRSAWAILRWSFISALHLDLI